jgi:hypothetical protein
MVSRRDTERIRDGLIAAVKQGDEAQARSLVFQLGDGPRQVRAALEAMLEDPRGLVRQAAAFGLGELGGAASIRRLEQQLAVEEARGDYDGQAVVEDIVRALGCIKEAGARASLVRRLERLMAGKPERSAINELAEALWRKRHPELLPIVQRTLEHAEAPRPNALHGLRVLLEKSPQDLGAWARDPAVPAEHKTEVLALLQEELPDDLRSVIPAFISTAQALLREAVSQDGEAAYYCECLLSVVLLHRERLLPSFAEETRSLLHGAARELVGAVSPNCSIRATHLLKFVGSPEDAELITAHRPSDAVGAKVFDEAAHALRALRKS